MDRTRPTEAKSPPPGEWAVFHERPFPKRLDRAFRLAAVSLGAVILAIGAAGAGYALATADAPVSPEAPLIFGTMLGPVAYGAVRAAGLIATSLYGFTRRKEYVLDWHEPVSAEKQGGLTAPDLAALALLVLSIFLSRALL